MIARVPAVPARLCSCHGQTASNLGAAVDFRLPRAFGRARICHNREAVMERSVTESPRTPKRRRVVRWVEGVLVGIAFFTLVVLGFDWLMAASL